MIVNRHATVSIVIAILAVVFVASALLRAVGLILWSRGERSGTSRRVLGLSRWASIAVVFLIAPAMALTQDSRLAVALVVLGPGVLILTAIDLAVVMIGKGTSGGVTSDSPVTGDRRA